MPDISVTIIARISIMMIAVKIYIGLFSSLYSICFLFFSISCFISLMRCSTFFAYTFLVSSSFLIPLWNAYSELLRFCFFFSCSKATLELFTSFHSFSKCPNSSVSLFMLTSFYFRPSVDSPHGSVVSVENLGNFVVCQSFCFLEVFNYCLEDCQSSVSEDAAG